MSKLHQIVAVEGGEKQRAQKALTAVYHKLQKDDLFSGLVRTYAPKEEDGPQFPTEKKELQFTVTEAVDEFETAMARLVDLTATKDYGNTTAFADVKIGKKVLIKNAPVPFLLFLEKKLEDLQTFVSKLPTLDRAKSWEHDTNSGLFKSKPEERLSTKKVQRALVLYPATPEHPAQTQMITEDIVQGTWTATDFSGGIPEKQKQAYLDRVNELRSAVKFARTEANEKEAPDREVAQNLFDFVFRS